jgi:hypothetical protein
VDVVAMFRVGTGGYGEAMTEEPDQDRVAGRQHLLPEEVAAGSDDPAAQAETILEDSDARTEDPEGTLHRSTQTPEY